MLSNLDDSLKPQGGEAIGPIQTRSLESPDYWQHILVTVAPGVISSLIPLLIAYVQKNNAKIKVTRGKTTIEVPSSKVSKEQIKELLESIAQNQQE